MTLEVWSPVLSRKLHAKPQMAARKRAAGRRKRLPTTNIFSFAFTLIQAEIKLLLVPNTNLGYSDYGAAAWPDEIDLAPDAKNATPFGSG